MAREKTALLELKKLKGKVLELLRCEPLNTLQDSKEVLSKSKSVGMEYSESLMQGRGLIKG